MVAQARAELPNECCGLLAGTPDGRVTHRFPLVNVAPDPQREFLSDNRGMLDAHKAMRTARIEPLAIYHSHPTSAPEPSRTDRERSYYGTTVVNLIISLHGSAPTVRAWWITENESWEADWELL
jgi:proteasome lid subunit RPN8/RPN11